MQQELLQKQKEIELLKKENQNLIKNQSHSSSDPATYTDNQPNPKYISFLEMRISECTEENKRYLSKYSDLRAFAYTQIENLVRKQQTMAKSKRVGPSTTLNQNNINVYKQLIEKERKQWMEERNQKDAFINQIQDKVRQVSGESEFFKGQVTELESDIQMREECEGKVNEYVQELVEKNQEL